MNVTEEVRDFAYYTMLNATLSQRELRKELTAKRKYDTRQADRIIAEAKQRIRDEVDSIKDIQMELNIYRLNKFLTDKDVSNSDKLKAIDILNKLLGFYTVKLELTRKTRFVLGASDDESVEYANYETVNDGQVERLLGKGGNDE